MIDDTLTKEIQRWFEQEPKTDAVIVEGAQLLLRINRNRILHQNICRKPQRFLSKLTYELQKHLRYRLDGLTLDEVRMMEKNVLPQIKQLLDAGEPVAQEEGQAETQDAEASPQPKLGRREDHDTLPDDIKALWTDNAERYKKMKEAYYTCLGLDMACDRYEYVKLLSESYKLYKEDMAKYDQWTPDAEPKDTATVKAISSARSYISKARTDYDTVAASGNGDKAAALKAKIQQRVDLLLNNNATLSEDLSAWLSERGFSIPSADEA